MHKKLCTVLAHRVPEVEGAPDLQSKNSADQKKDSAVLFFLLLELLIMIVIFIGGS